MEKGKLICLFFLMGSLSFMLKAQNAADSTTEKKDRHNINIKDVGLLKDSVQQINDLGIPVVDTLTYEQALSLKKEFKPSSKKAVIYSALCPGLGQIYNRKYWKLPIVYGGIVGISYAISWNGRNYNDYSKAYRDIMTGEGDSWVNMIPGNITSLDDLTPAQQTQLKASFKRKKDYFRQNRDLAIIVMVGFYALCMVDAYVDAQLYDFDISPDLSMHIEPMLMFPTPYSKTTIGLQCRFVF